MKLRTIIILVAAGVMLAVAVLLLFSSYYDSVQKSEKVRDLVNEGFLVLKNDPDEAVRLALTARDIAPESVDAVFLLGRANAVKEKHKNAIKIFEEGTNLVDDMGLLNELYYHIGLAWLNLYEETNIDDCRIEALKHLSDAAKMGNHRADANLALGGLYGMAGYVDKDKIIFYWERAFRIEREMAGYPGSDDDGACPNCRMEFIRKEPDLIEQYKILAGNS